LVFLDSSGSFTMLAAILRASSLEFMRGLLPYSELAKLAEGPLFFTLPTIVDRTNLQCASAIESITTRHFTNGYLIDIGALGISPKNGRGPRSTIYLEATGVRL
jgi:hypothetical protein